MKQEDAKKEAQRILHAPEAQQLLALLSRGGGQTLQQAAAAAQRGDMAGAQAMRLSAMARSRAFFPSASRLRMLGHAARVFFRISNVVIGLSSLPESGCPPADPPQCHTAPPDGGRWR